MTEAPTQHTQHAIDYIEFTVTDLARAKEFYGKAFGWQFNDYGPGYAGIQGADREVGGMAQGEVVSKGGPLVVLYSSNLEATLAAILEAGGTLAKPIFEFPGGKRFHFQDPSSNELAVWCPT